MSPSQSQKPEQLRWLEAQLKRRLFPLSSGNLTDFWNRKCYELDSEGHVVGLNLANCAVTDGTFLQKLPQLTTLSLSYSPISDWSFLQRLPQLTTLDLRGNVITDGSFLQKLPRLTTLFLLSLSANSITDWSFLQKLPQLTTLYLSSNRITDWSFLQKLPQLTSLFLYDDDIEDGSFLQKLPQLTTLFLYCGDIRDWSFLQKLPQLATLNLRSNRIADWSFLQKLPQLTRLDLSGSGISDGSFLQKLPQLTKLSLGSNSITDGSFLPKLPQLTTLDLSGNGITDWSFLPKLPQLTTLDLSGSGITDWSFLQKLPQLTTLYLSSNRITDGSFLQKLPQLTTLYLGDNGITDGSFLQKLPQLTTLYLSHNRITDGSFLQKLPQLTTLYLSSNRITDGSFLQKLPQLTTLDLSKNQLRRIDASLLALDLELEWGEDDFRGLPHSIKLFGNPIETPPLEIAKQGDRAIRAWFAEREQGEVPLNEVKVILVGEGEAGKTTVRKRLMGVAPNPKESQTHGIEIHKHQIDCHGEKILVRFWDFGGQEILHATHQFFLSRRSLYIVVLDGRKEEDPDYWLKHIESFGGTSPILVCLNKMDENPSFEVNRSDLQKKYAGIQGFYRLKSLDKNDAGIKQLLSDLPQHLLKVELAKEKWPKRYFQIKEQLETDDKPYIERREFEQICNDFKVTDEDSQTALVRYLNDLGIALHFEDDRLQLLQILNPRWATQAVYRLITDEKVAAAKGLLSRSDLPKILKKTKDEHLEYPKEKHGYILDLMRKFELCYDVSGDQVLFPDLLDVQEPETSISTTDVLRFRFEYDFLPRSILPRFMVRHHTEIDGTLRWRTGVVLQSKNWNARARIRADKSLRRISIEVEGINRRDYFAILRQTFEDIHGQFTKLNVARKVPLPDQPEESLDYDLLLASEVKGIKKIVGGKPPKVYDVVKLLNGIEPLAARKARRQKAGGNTIIVENGAVYKHIEGDDMSNNQSVGDNNRNISLAFGKNINATVAESITNSFNRADDAKRDEMKLLLQQLSQEVAKIVERLSGEQGEEAARDLDTITTQATAEKPSKKYWELSKKGLIDAATAVGAIGTVAIGLAEKISKLLWG